MDKHKDNEIRLEKCHLLKLSKEVMRMAENNPELLNAVYKEISEKLGMDTAMEIYQMFKGQQISFPMRFFNPAKIQQMIVREYDGSNIKILAVKYGYSEKSVRRIIKESLEGKGILMFYLIIGIIVLYAIFATIKEEGSGLAIFGVLALMTALACLLVHLITDWEFMLTVAKLSGVGTVISLLIGVYKFFAD